VHHFVPEHIYWSINDKPYATFKEFLDRHEKLTSFEYDIKGVAKKFGSFREECLNAAALLARNSDRHFAVPVSGSDSEIVVRSLHTHGAKCTIYYEDYPWADPEFKKLSQEIATELNYDWISFDADYDECLERMKFFSVELGNMSRGFLITLGLFEKIPKDQFIVGGLGDFEKDGALYRTIIERNIGADWHKKKLFPCPSTEIIWRLYGDKFKRDGEFYFFNSTLPLIASQANHPKLSYGLSTDGVSSTVEMKNFEWPELTFKEKTNHFQPSEDFYDGIYSEMEEHMYEHYDSSLFTLVKDGFCGFVDLDKFNV
jgi:hypothetical protein